MRLVYLSFLVCFTLVLFLLSSCNPARRLSAEQHLLEKNEILIKNEKVLPVPGFEAINKIEVVGKLNDKISTELFDKMTDELEPLIRQKPNRKLLGFFRFHLRVYNFFNHGKERKVKSWIKRTIGEEPVIYDAGLSMKTREQFELYLKNKGFFNAVVTYEDELKKNHKAFVTYTVVPGEPYTINTITQNIKDEGLKEYWDLISNKSLIKKGDNFDSDKLVKERERIAAALKNQGYFYFTKEYVFYDIDSALGTHQVNVTVGINRVNEINSDSTIRPQNHQKYFIGTVDVRTDYNPKLLEDTAKVKEMEYNGLHILFKSKKPMIKPKTLRRVVFLKSGELFQVSNQDLTYSHLGDLGIFKFTGIKYAEDKSDSLNRFKLNCDIQLTPSYRQSYSYDLEGTSRGGNLGIGGNVAYRNKNLFRGAEQLEVRIAGGLEAQRTFIRNETDTSTIDPLNVFNTLEISPQTSLSFPKFLVPWRQSIGMNARPKTYFDLSYNYQQKQAYTRGITKLGLTYQWNESRTKRWIVSPVDLNLVDISRKSEAFTEHLKTSSSTIRALYAPHLIPAGRVSYIINTQDILKKKNFWYFRINFETAGNLIWGVSHLLYPSGSFVLKYKDIDYSQYIRPDADLKYYHILDEHNKIVYRIAGGIGLPYGNTKPRVMPFEKTFFGGGANDLRAWAIRSVGPGSDSTTNNFERTGDIKFISNIEYRFDLVKFFEGAIFADAGNVWMRKDTANPNAEFQLRNEKYLNEMAIDAGVGLRLNFSFFVFRLDYAVKMRDPSVSENERWVVTNTRIGKLLGKEYSRFQLGIGYPF